PSTPRPPALVTAATTSRQCVKAKIGKSIPNSVATLVFIAFRLSAYRSWPVAFLDRRRRGFLRVCRSTALLTAYAVPTAEKRPGPAVGVMSRAPSCPHVSTGERRRERTPCGSARPLQRRVSPGEPKNNCNVITSPPPV